MYNFIAYLRYIYAKRKQLVFFCVLFGCQIVLSMQMRNVAFPKDFLELSKTAKNMISDVGEPAEILISLPASEKTINDVFFIFALYNAGGVASGSIRKEVESYEFHRLVNVANLLQRLDVLDSIMNLVMDQIAHILQHILGLSLQSLYQPAQVVIIPNYEALRDLNLDVERMIKQNFKIQHVLQWHIERIWKFFGRNNFEQVAEQFKNSNETIASFLDRNVIGVMKKFNEEKKQKNSSKDLSTNDTSVKNNNQNVVLGAILAGAAIAGLLKLYEYFKQQQE